MYLLLVSIPLVIGFGFIFYSLEKDIEKDIESKLRRKI